MNKNKFNEFTNMMDHDKFYETYIKNTFNLDLTEIYNLFLKYFKGKNILDLGCGHGRDTLFFSNKGFNLTGIDVSIKLLEHAKKICPKAKFILEDMRELNFKKEEFDGVWAMASLFKIKKEELPIVLKKINYILKKEGIFFLAIKKGKGEKIFFDENDKVEKFDAFFKFEEIKKLLNKNGFKIIDKIDAFYKTEWINIVAKKESLI